MEYIRKYYDARDGTVKVDYLYIRADGLIFGCNGAASVDEAKETVRQQGYDWFCNLVPAGRW